MTKPVRVMIVDDSSTIRMLVTKALADEPDIEVVGRASSGGQALAKLPVVKPDLVTLDIEMPGMDGLETLAAIRAQAPHLPVVMFSSLTQRGAAATLDALGKGASDYLTKPTGHSGFDDAMGIVRSQLIPKIRAPAGHRAAMAVPSPPLPTPIRRRRVSRAPIGILAVGSSTGGPNALAKVFADLPRTLRVPVVVVQHMPPVFTELLARRLDATSDIEFREACHGDEIRPGLALIAPGDKHLTVVRRHHKVLAVLSDAPPENSCRPSVDVLLRSVADVYGAGVLAAVLTGMGQDGLAGCEVVKEKGGQVVVQDEASSVVWGMPGFVARAGLADSVTPLDRIARELLARITTRERAHAQ